LLHNSIAATCSLVDFAVGFLDFLGAGFEGLGVRAALSNFCANSISAASPSDRILLMMLLTLLQGQRGFLVCLRLLAQFLGSSVAL
jgi:hypothetical protein